ncbi:hypothetical protein BJ165DRAFT_1440797 [Panaeolus papilionaceus]|nr:hypothetical protein BJ165DRAFT_1440797 [Panaeolus papilionaceus]
MTFCPACIKFIESLAGSSQNLSLSKDQLAGYTQSVTAYRVMNVYRKHWSSPRRPVFLVDTPGFADTQFSQKEIVDMVQKWMIRNGLVFMVAIDA